MQSTSTLVTGLPNERYALVYLLPRKVQLQIEDTYLHWQGITRPPMGYHVSVLGPFMVVEGHTQDDLGVIADLCLKQPSFHLLLGEPGVFRNAASQVAYLALYNPDPMRMLHGAMLEGTQSIVAAPSPEYHLWTIEQYVPHVTLGISLNEETAAEFLLYARSHPCSLRCQVNELSLLKQQGSGIWQHLNTFTLQGKRTNYTS
ncbi:MAG: 2'-5' RNA ligase family protein [Anaerolineae bacterium]